MESEKSRNLSIVIILMLVASFISGIAFTILRFAKLSKKMRTEETTIEKEYITLPNQ